MKRLYLLVFIIFFSCSKEDNSGYLDQISSLQTQNSALRSQINEIQNNLSQVSTNYANSQVQISTLTASVSELEASLTQALINYENAVIDVAALQADLAGIKNQYRIITLWIESFFDEFGYQSDFFWDNTYDQNGVARGAYLYEFGQDTSGQTSIPFDTGTDVFYPIFKTYTWNGDCWVYLPQLSLVNTSGTNSKITMISKSSITGEYTIKFANYNVVAPSIGLTSGYDTVNVFTTFIVTPAVINGFYAPTLSFKRSVSESEAVNGSYPQIYTTNYTTSELPKSRTESISDICPD
jgi:hypothetical protein